MQEIAFEIDAQRVGRASGYLGGLTVERYTFTGATLPAGTRLAILTRAGVTIAAAEITEGNAATVDTNTQEVADLLRYQPLGACESVYIAIGNADTIIALIPAVMRKNWLDDEATHPPVPANRYPTKTELDEWLARFDERAAAAETAKADAQEAAAQAAQSATDARAAKTAAETAATVAQTAQVKAEAAQAAAETAQEGAEAAKEAASQSATAASQSAQEAAENVTALLQDKLDAAEAAKAGAEAAKTAAETAKTGAESAQAAAASSATSAANSASAAAKSATDLADAVATAESLDERIVDVEHDLSGGAKIEVVGKDKRTLGTYGGWYGTMASLGVPESKYFTSCGISQIVLWKNGTSDARNYNRLALYYYDEAEQLWTLWGRSDVMSSNPGGAYPYGTRFVFNITKEASAPMLTRDTKVYFTFKDDGSTAIGTSNCNLQMFGVSLAFDIYGYGVCSGVPTAAGAANGARNTDYCREVGYYYLDNAGVRVDAAGAPIASVGTLILHNDQRIGALEAGTGAYIIQSRDVIPYGKPTSADVGKVLYFDHFANETTSTLAVTNRTPWAQKVCPAPIVANNPDVCAVGCFDYARNKKYIVFMTAISINPIGYLYELNVGAYGSTLTFKSKLATSYYSDSMVGASYWCRNICAHDGHIFYTRRHSNGGPYLAVCDVETGKAVAELDLDPKDTGGVYVNSAIWYNPLSGHICVLCYAFSLPTGETWVGSDNSNGNTHFIRVFSWDSETKTLSDIPDGDIPATIIDVTDAVAEGLGGTHWQGYGSTWPIRDQVFVSIQGRSYMALFHATADDRIEPCYEWDVEYATGEDGITRPVWETQPEEWKDADGNTQTIQNYVRNYYYDKSLIPRMTKGRLLKFCAATDYEGPPSGTWAANPMFFNASYGYCVSRENVLGKSNITGRYAPSHIILTNGVEKWKMFDGAKFVNLYAFNNLNHLKDPAGASSVEYAPARDETTGVYLLDDVRKGGTRKYTGWLPKSGQYITNVGSVGYYARPTDVCLLTPLTSAQSGTPLSRIGMVSNAGTDSAEMTPLPTTATYSSDWWLSSMLPYCAWGFFGNVWMTDYNKTIGGVL